MTKTTSGHLLDILAEVPDSRNNPGYLVFASDLSFRLQMLTFFRNVASMKKHPSKNTRS